MFFKVHKTFKRLIAYSKDPLITVFNAFLFVVFIFLSFSFKLNPRS